MTQRQARHAANACLIALIGLLVLLVTARLVNAATFVVNSTCDNVDANAGNGLCEDSGGDCCLRAAIGEVNAGAGGDTIAFGIAGAGPHTITLGSELPTVTANNTTIDGTTEPGTVCCTGWDCSAAAWMIKIDADGGDFNILTFQLGTTATVRGLELINDLPTAEYGITFDTGTATCNSVHGMRGGIALSTGGLIGGPGANAANLAYNLGEFGFTSRAPSGSTIQGNVACLDATGEADGGAMNYGVYAEGCDGLTVSGNLIAGCDEAGVFVRSDAANTIVSDNTVGPTRSGALTLCFGFSAFADEASDTTFEDNTLCPSTGCCNVEGLEGFGVACWDGSMGPGTNPYSQADCQTLVGGEGGTATSFNPDAVCFPNVSGSCPPVPTPTGTSTSTATATGTATNTPVDTATSTATATQTGTATGTVTDTPTATGTPTATATDTYTATATGTATFTATPTEVDTDTPTATATDTPTPTATGTETHTATATATATPVDTATATVTATATGTATQTPTVTATSTHTSTPTLTPTATNTPLAPHTATPAKPIRLRHYRILVPNVRAQKG